MTIYQRVPSGTALNFSLYRELAESATPFRCGEIDDIEESAYALFINIFYWYEDEWDDGFNVVARGVGDLTDQHRYMAINLKTGVLLCLSDGDLIAPVKNASLHFDA